MTEVVCPCCDGRGKIEERTPVPLTKLQTKIFNIVRKSQHGIEGPRLAEKVYADRADGGPVFAKDVIYLGIMHANKRLKSVGLKIKASARGPGSVYTLERNVQVSS